MIETNIPKFIVESISHLSEDSDKNHSKFGQKISGIAFVNGISLSQVKSIQKVIGNEMYCHKMRKSEEEISDLNKENFSFHRAKQNVSQTQHGPEKSKSKSLSKEF